MKARGNKEYIRIELDADDLMPLVSKVVHKVIESDKILWLMNSYNENKGYTNYLEVIRELGINPYEILLTRDMAITFSDELVSRLFSDESIAEIYELPTKEQKDSHLKMARICVICHKAFIGEKGKHNCDE